MNLPCKVVEDLLPMYYDSVCSEESAALVEAHLKDCPSCSQILSDLRADIAIPEKNADDIRPLKKIQKKYRRLQLGWLVAIVCLLVLIPTVFLIGVWRFWPQSFSNLISVSETSIASFSASAMTQRLENGQPHTDMYRIDNTDGPGDVLDILATTGYRRDLRNLLPWNLGHVASDKNYDGRTVTLAFYTGTKTDDCIHVQFLSSSVIAVSFGADDGFRIYHPTNRSTLDALMEYLQAHGIRQ